MSKIDWVQNDLPPVGLLFLGAIRYIEGDDVKWCIDVFTVGEDGYLYFANHNSTGGVSGYKVEALAAYAPINFPQP
jgi:hypothetical protein